MELIYLKSLLSLAAILGLLYLFLKLVQRYSKFGTNNIAGLAKEHAITINSIAYIDASTKVINFKCGNKIYLVLLGKNNLVIDSYENKPN